MDFTKVSQFIINSVKIFLYGVLVYIIIHFSKQFKHLIQTALEGAETGAGMFEGALEWIDHCLMHTDGIDENDKCKDYIWNAALGSSVGIGGSYECKNCCPDIPCGTETNKGWRVPDEHCICCDSSPGSSDDCPGTDVSDTWYSTNYNEEAEADTARKYNPKTCIFKDMPSCAVGKGIIGAVITAVLAPYILALFSLLTTIGSFFWKKIGKDSIQQGAEGGHDSTATEENLDKLGKEISRKVSEGDREVIEKELNRIETELDGNELEEFQESRDENRKKLRELIQDRDKPGALSEFKGKTGWTIYPYNDNTLEIKDHLTRLDTEMKVRKQMNGKEALKQHLRDDLQMRDIDIRELTASYDNANIGQRTIDILNNDTREARESRESDRDEGREGTEDPKEREDREDRERESAIREHLESHRGARGPRP